MPSHLSHMSLADRIAFWFALATSLAMLIVGISTLFEFPGLSAILIPGSGAMVWGSLHILAQDAKKASAPSTKSAVLMVVDVEMPEKKDIA